MSPVRAAVGCVFPKVIRQDSRYLPAYGSASTAAKPLAAIYLVLPKLIAVLGEWPRLSTLNPIWFTVALAAEIASFTCNFALQRLALGTRGWFAEVTAGLAGNAVTRSGEVAKTTAHADEPRGEDDGHPAEADADAVVDVGQGIEPAQPDDQQTGYRQGQKECCAQGRVYLRLPAAQVFPVPVHAFSAQRTCTPGQRRKSRLPAGSGRRVHASPPASASSSPLRQVVGPALRMA